MPTVRKQNTPTGKALYITIPKAIWELLGIVEGDKVDFKLIEGELFLKHTSHQEKVKAA